MPDENISAKFPQTSQDINNLKQTATDAAAQAKEHIGNLKEHAVSEAGDQLQQLQASLNQAVQSAKAYASQRPLLCMGVALGVGMLFGMCRRSSCRDVD